MPLCSLRAISAMLMAVDVPLTEAWGGAHTLSLHGHTFPCLFPPFFFLICCLQLAHYLLHSVLKSIRTLFESLICLKAILLFPHPVQRQCTLSKGAVRLDSGKIPGQLQQPRVGQWEGPGCPSPWAHSFTKGWFWVSIWLQGENFIQNSNPQVVASASTRNPFQKQCWALLEVAQPSVYSWNSVPGAWLKPSA